MTPIEVLNEKGIKLAVNHLDDVDGYDKEKQLLAVFAARYVQHLMPRVSIDALDVADRYADGLATEQELKNAAYAAYAAAAALSARDAVAAAADSAVYVAAYASYAVSDAVDAACCALDSEEKQAYWQAIETKFKELFEEK